MLTSQINVTEVLHHVTVVLQWCYTCYSIVVKYNINFLQIPIMTEQDLQLTFSVLTSDHLPFDNSSSLLFEIASSDSTRFVAVVL